MAEIIPNQPIIFSEELDCSLETCDIKMLAQWGDVSQFQMKLEPCASDLELIRNGGFVDSSNWSLGSGWTISDGQACHAVSLFSSISQVAPVADGVLVKLTIDIEVSAIGCLVQWGSFITNITTSGTHTFWFVADGAASFGVACAAQGAVCISSISALTVNTNFKVAILDEDNTPVDVILVSDGYFDFTNGWFTASIDWETLGIPTGCYRLAVVDPCYCAQSGIVALDFITAIHQWDLAAEWSILAGTATFTGSSTNDATLHNVLCDGVTYQVTYTLAGMGAGEQFTVRLGSAAGTTRTVDGTYTETITCNGNDFTMRGNSTGGTQTFTVTDMSIEAVSASIVPVLSNLIRVSSTDFGCPTHRIALCNDSDGLGFGFDGTGFSPSFRTESSLSRGSSVGVRESYDYSDGNKRTTYGRVRIVRELGMDTLPHLVDFMMLTPYADHFYIDDDEYFVEDDEFPSVSWAEFEHWGGFTLNVSKKLQKIENRRLSSAVKGCSPLGVEMQAEQGGTIDDELGSAVLLDT